MTIAIRGPNSKDRAVWERLYQGYATFYRVAQTPEMRARVWGWIMEPAHEVKCLLAEAEGGAVVGFTHFRPFARPLSASIGGYLDDLFVDPEARGSGAAQALIGGVVDIGRARGWGVVRWITADDNARARKVYDRVATETPWVTYDIKI